MTGTRPARHDAATLIATWFGVGYAPFAPGSWGSLAALPFAFGLLPAGLAWLYPVLRPVGWLARRWKLRRD